MRKKIFNKIVLLCILLLICVCFTGCASVDFITYCNDDGTINEYVYISLDAEELNSYGYNITDVQAEIENYSENIVSSLISDYNYKLLQTYKSGEISFEEYDYFNNKLNDIKVSEIKSSWSDNSYIIGLQFKNSKIYKKYYQLLNNITNDEPSAEPLEIEKTFYTKTYYYGTVGYSDYSLFNQVYNHYALMFSDIPNENTTLTYSYAINSRRYHSNADSILIDSNGNYIHTWNVNPNELDNQIYFYTLKANKSVWILLCIAIGLTICVILCIIGVIKLSIERKNKIEIEESTDTTE